MKPTDLDSSDEYRSYVEHPRFGRGPRYTGLNPSSLSEGGAHHLHWNGVRGKRIPMTAVLADTSKQVQATYPVEYYFDVRETCRDCRRKFIFFAEEQKYWYEELGFRLDVACVRCHDCRRKQRGVDRARERYNELVTQGEPGPAESLELATLSLDLIAAGVFARHPSTVSRVRMWLNRVARDPAHDAARLELTQRLVQLEKSARG